jgi:hypothetical protein
MVTQRKRDITKENSIMSSSMVILNQVGAIDVSQGFVTKQIGLFGKRAAPIKRI